jgi:uncharacterized protein
MKHPLQLTDSNETFEHENEIPENIDFTWGVKIPMRDGSDLNATIYRPKAREPIPAIFTLTPYIADTYHERAYYFAQHGYAFSLVDCRGRGNSSGDFEPFVNEGRDGYDVVEWLAAQTWCNGAVTMWGGSYAGFNQWMTLKESPPHLSTIVPAASAHAGVDFPFHNNIFYPYEIQWLTFTSGLTGNSNLFNEASFWITKFRERFLNHRPFSELDQITGNSSTHFQTWIEHPTPDAYWEQMALTPEEYASIDFPILTITGYYDGDQPGAMAYYQQHMRYGSEVGRSKHFLILGPWDHPGTRTPAKEFGGLRFDDACLLDMNELHKGWYDWTMKGGEQPEFLKKRVAYYLMGAEQWKYSDGLDSISSDTLRLFLDSNGSANDVFQSGQLMDTTPGSSPPDSYIYDPLDTRPAELERHKIEDYLIDQRYAHNLYGNGLVYHSQAFQEDMEITGYVRFVAWIALDVPDTDFEVTLSEILLDGAHITLTQDRLRARYRESLRQEKLIVPGEINRFEFAGFTFFSRQIAKGSHLRLLIQCPNTIYLQKNYNSGGAIALETMYDARTAHVLLYHDAEHPSYIELPLVKEG